MVYRHPKRYLIEQDKEDIIYQKWLMNLKAYWLLHQQVLDEIANDSLSFSTADTFYDSWIAVVALYSYAKAMWTLPTTWKLAEHKEKRKHIEEQMKEIRSATKPIKKQVDKVIYEYRNQTNREDERRDSTTKAKQNRQKRGTHRRTILS